MKIKKSLKSLVMACLFAAGGCFGVKAELHDYKVNRVKNTLSLEAGVDFSGTTHHLSSTKTYFSPAPSTSLDGDTSNTSGSYSLALDLRNSSHLNHLNFNTGLKLHQTVIEVPAHEITGFMSGPWDVDYFAGVMPNTSIEPYIGLEKKLNRHWNMDFSLGFPYTYFLWKKGYLEQIDDSTTILETESSEKQGLSIGLGLEYFIERDFLFRIGLEQAYYPDVEIAGETTDIENTRLDAMFKWRFK